MGKPEQELQTLETVPQSEPVKSGLDAAPPVSFSRIYSILNSREKLILGISIFFAIASGAVVPGFILLVGETINTFGPDATDDEIMDEVVKLTIYNIGRLLIYQCLHICFGIQYRRRNLGIEASKDVLWRCSSSRNCVV